MNKPEDSRLNYSRGLTERILLWLLVVLCFTAVVIQVIWDIGEHPVKIWDEAATAANAIEMLENKNFLVVHINDYPDHFNTRPPLAVWTKVITYSMLGITPLAIRLPGVIASILLVLTLMFFLAKQLRNPVYLLISLIIIATTEGYLQYHIVRTGDPDALLVFFTCIYALVFFLLLEAYPRKRNLYFTLFGVGIVLAYYTKSFAGLFPLIPLGIYMLIHRNGLIVLKDRRFWLTAIFSLITIASYYLLREISDPGYLKAVWLNEIGIIGEPIEIKHPEAGFYIDYLFYAAYKPHYYFLPLAFITYFITKNKTVKRLLLFALINILVLIAGYSMATIKNEWYIAPVYPFLWIFTGVGLTEFVMFVTGYVKHYYIRKTLIYTFVMVFALIVYPYYVKIFNMNTNDPLRFDFRPETAGNFLYKVKTDMPQLQRIHIVSREESRQLKFYASKFNYEDAAVFSYSDTIPPLTGIKYLIICDHKMQQQFERTHNPVIIKEDEFCKLYRRGKE